MSKKRKISESFTYFCSTLILIIALVGAYMTAELWDDFQLGRNFDQGDLSYPVILTDRNGKEIHRIFGQENREWVDLGDISTDLQKMTLLAEDQRFYQHLGIDIKGIMRAMRTNFQTKSYSQGASTLTQQIARKVYLTDDKSLYRKVREVAISLGIESHLTKDEILEIYLNTVPYGPRINGVKLASQTYFGKHPKALSFSEALVLSTMPKDPIRLSRKSNIDQWLGTCGEEDVCSPFESVEYQSSRIENLLIQHAETEGWNDVQTQRIWAELSNIKLDDFRRRWTNDDYQHWQFYVRDFLQSEGINFSNYEKGLVIKTSLDSELQNKIYDFIRGGKSAELYEKHNAENLSLTIIDHQTRSPLVWIGSKYFWNSDISGQIDMLRSRRQPGSTMKPMIYAAAIDNGYEPATLLSDTPISFKGSKYRVNNSDGRFWGRMTMSKALNWSRNIPAVKAFYLAGGEKRTRKYLDHIFGLKTNQDYKDHRFGWSLALGTAGLEVKDIANAYATIATGRYTKLCPILSMTDSLGNLLPNPCAKHIARGMNPKTSFFVRDMMSDPDKKAQAISQWLIPKKYPGLGVKTGTASKRVNNELRPSDNLVAGFTPHATMVLWAGNTNGRALNAGSFSLYSIGPLWRDIMSQFLDAYPDKYARFTVPENLKQELVRYRGEWVSKEYTDKPYTELYTSQLRDSGDWLNSSQPPQVAEVQSDVAPEYAEEDSVPVPSVEAIVGISPQPKESLIDISKVKERIMGRRSQRW